VSWYDERSASAGDGFVAEIDARLNSSPPPSALAPWRTWHQKIRPLTIPFAVIYREKPTTIQILAFATVTAAPDIGSGAFKPKSPQPEKSKPGATHRALCDAWDSTKASPSRTS